MDEYGSQAEEQQQEQLCSTIAPQRGLKVMKCTWTQRHQQDGDLRQSTLKRQMEVKGKEPQAGPPMTNTLSTWHRAP